MTVANRKIADTDRDYLAYARKFAGRATCFVYFQDNLGGAVALHNFAEMLRLAWGHRPQLRIVEQDLSSALVPRHAIRCRASLQTGNYPHSARIRADYIAAFPSTRSRALTPIHPSLRSRPASFLRNPEPSG